jgi:hypothetical protein
MTVADIARGGALNTYSGPGYQYAGEKAPRSRGWSWTSFDEAWNYGFPQEMGISCSASSRDGHRCSAAKRDAPSSR